MIFQLGIINILNKVDNFSNQLFNYQFTQNIQGHRDNGIKHKHFHRLIGIKFSSFGHVNLLHQEVRTSGTFLG